MVNSLKEAVANLDNAKILDNEVDKATDESIAMSKIDKAKILRKEVRDFCLRIKSFNAYEL